MPSGIDASLVKLLPQSVLEALPAATPPPGVVPNFENPETRVPVLMRVGSVVTAIASLVFFIRAYTKSFILRAWKWDDVLVSLSFLLTLMNFAIMVWGCIHGTMGRHNYEYHMDRVLTEDYFYRTYIPEVISHPAVGFIKLGLFIQYYLLFRVRRYIRISVYIGATITAVFYTAASIVSFILCTQRPGEDMLDTMTSAHMLEFHKLILPSGIIGLVLDVVLFILPIQAILPLQMSLWKKLGMVLIFMTGAFAIIASAISVYYRVDFQKNSADTSWKFSYILLWVHAEVCAGITASSMPSVRQFFVRYKFLSKSSSFMASYTPRFSSIRHPTKRAGQRGLLSGRNGFKQWGYMHNTTVDVEDSFTTSGETCTSVEPKNSNTGLTEPSAVWKPERTGEK